MLGGGKFQPNLVASAERVLVQTNDGKRRLLDTDTGRVLAQAGCSADFCPSPLAVEEGRKVCLSLEDGVIVLLDLRAGVELWRFTYPWRSSLTGEPVLLLEQDGFFWAVFPLNYGQEIWRLDLANGKAIWPAPILLPAAGSAWCTGKPGRGSARPYCCFVLDNRIQCRDLHEGRILWQRPLPAGAARWRLACAGQALIVVPDEPIRPPRLPIFGLDLYPLVEAMQPAPSSEPAVWLLDASDGSPLRRLAVISSRLQALLTPAGIVLADNGSIRGYLSKR